MKRGIYKMTTVEFLFSLNSLGVKIWIEDDQLRYRAPKGVMTSALKQELGERKTQILAFLREAKTAKEFTSEPIIPVKRDSNLSLSFSQHRMWFVYQLDSQNPFYNESFQFRIIGALNVTALEQSINEIIRRHEALRTIFPTVDGVAVQRILSTLTVNIPVVDLQGLKEAEVQQIITKDVRQPFDLGKAPLLRVILLRLEPEFHLLILTLHHIIIDGWSMGIFIKELSALYQAFSTGSPTPLPELTIQYGDFTIWQRQWLTEELQQQQLDYWKQQLASAPPLLDLPTDYPRPSVQTFSGAIKEFKLNSNLTAQLKTLSQKSGTTLFVTLLAAFALLLHRYSSQDDICIGSPFANRNRTEVESLIGFFVNTLVLRTQIKENPSFSEFLTQVQQVVLDAHAHQDVPFEQVVETLKPERSTSYNPLFQAMFVLENFSLDTLELPGITLTPELVERGTAPFDLTLFIWETQKGLMGLWQYNSDLFEANTIARMTGHFQTLLEAIVEVPNKKIGELPLLTESERYQLLVEWNNTTKEYPFDQCIHQLFEAQVERSPGAIAVVFEDKQLTYLELNQRANRIAHHLGTLGVGPKVLVGICVERSLEMIVGLLGILKAGGAYVPLDPAYPSERLAYMLKDASVPVLLTQAHLVEKLPQDSARIVCLDYDWSKIADQVKSNPTSDVTPDNLAYIIYTSGSTGKPKGVTVTHQAVNRLVLNTNYVNLQSTDVVAFASNFSFDAATFEIWGALLHGARLVGVSKDVVLSPRDFADFIHLQEISVLFLTTALFNQMASVVPSAFHSVQHLLFGGEAVDAKWVKEVLKNGPPQRLLHVYGPTESTTFTTWYLVQDVPEGAKIIPIGRPISNTHCFLLDAQLQPVPIGVPGDLYIGGGGLAKGYLNRPDLTDEKFIPNPFSNKLGSRLYKTGDKARYLSDGNIEFLGRIDNQVKIRGFRIELGEIEAAIAQYPTVQETVVVAREDIPGRKYLAAYIVSNQSNTPISSELRGFLKQILPDYMMPGSFVILDALPLTPNGKVDRQALPVPLTSNDSDSFVLPNTSTEKILAGIWKDVLGLEKVGIHDNFFELGGDSIISLQILARANQAGLQITTKQLFQHQTIADLAAVASTTSSIKTDQGLVTGVVPLTPIQHWFFDQNWSEPHHFNQSMLLVVPPDLKPELLEQAVKELMVHHDALRMRFVLDESGWQQRNTDICKDVPFQVRDLSALGVEEHKAAIERIAAFLQTTLNLEEGPLLRVVLFNLGSDRPSRLLLIIHHLVVDGVSWRILLEDIATAYKQLSRQEAIQLPPKTTSFQDWAIKQRDYELEPVLELELDYWLAQSSTDTTPLPVDFPDGIEANTEGSTASISVFLSAEETRTLLQEVPSVYNTQINDVLLTALVQTFAQWTGSGDLLIALEGHGREELFDDVDLSRTVGWFTTIFPVLLQLGETDSPEVALKSIKEQLRRIPNRGIGYGILRYLSQNADIGKQLCGLTTPSLCFNYLGQFDQVRAEPISLGFAPENPGLVFSPLAHRSHLLDVTGQVVEGKLQMIWIYSQNIHRRSTIERLASEYNSALKALIAHCQSPDSGGYTPTDFPLADLGQEELDELLSEID